MSKVQMLYRVLSHSKPADEMADIQMLDRIKSLFHSLPNAGSLPTPDTPHAIGTLLVRAAKADKLYLLEEIEVIDDLLAYQFNLTPEQAAQLRQDCEALDMAFSETEDFANDLRDSISYDERVATILSLWEVVFADGQAVDAEEDLLSQLETLLGVPSEKSRELHELAKAAA